jgi:hypothetical protein
VVVGARHHDRDRCCRCRHHPLFVALEPADALIFQATECAQSECSVEDVTWLILALKAEQKNLHEDLKRFTKTNDDVFIIDDDNDDDATTTTITTTTAPVDGKSTRSNNEHHHHHHGNDHASNDDDNSTFA